MRQNGQKLLLKNSKFFMTYANRLNFLHLNENKIYLNILACLQDGIPFQKTILRIRMILTSPNLRLYKNLNPIKKLFIPSDRA